MECSVPQVYCAEHAQSRDLVQAMNNLLGNSDDLHLVDSVIELSQSEWATQGTLDLQMERTAMVASDGSTPLNPRDLEDEVEGMLPNISVADVVRELRNMILHTRESSSVASSQQFSDGMLQDHGNAL